MPIRTGIDTGEEVRISAPATPPMAKGSENRMVKGWITLPNNRISTVSTSISPRIIALPKLATSSCWISASPDSATRTPGGSSTEATISLNRAVAVPSATPGGRLAPMVASRSRFLRSTALAPSATPISATAESGTVPPCAVGTRSAPSRARSPRVSSDSCTRTGISRSSTDTFASAAS